jgi:hypothetical protein
LESPLHCFNPKVLLKTIGEDTDMRNRYLMILPGLALILTAGCTGPSVTNSDNSGTGDQALSILKRDIDAKKDETLAAGTVIRTSLQHALTTDSNAPGDPFTAKVVDDVKVNNTIVIPIGSTVKGVVAESKRSGRVQGRAYMSLKFTEVVLPNGQSYPVQASGASRTAPGTKKKDAMIIGGGAGIGTAIGAIAGGGKGAAIGAATGGAAGTGAVLATRGKETGFASGSALNVKLTQPMRVNLS